MRFQVDTVASPGQVVRALTDFSDRRLQTWSRTLDPRTYELRAQGDTWAVARESSPRSPFWVVARYDWSQPSVVRWTVEESSYGGGGQGRISISPRTGGGSRLVVEYDNTGARPSQKPLVFVLHHGPMGRIIARMWASSLDRYARAGGEPA
ncbi:hypothetical protein [Nocardioides sp. Soil805]|uniref:hypothetical protein n=1 Tax=Nocardioides sp. Soil805 TaxID=1736416 RepID=UPI0007037428|nr:hypothetical protein [Nocardioides sp. Soil805]KRF37246.1 hypothetical protein ASG94_07855 [Nocardioides sp. Soil805]